MIAERTTLTLTEWAELTVGERPQCPPCCEIMSELAAAIRRIRQFDLDIGYAVQLIEVYIDACITHDLSMFPALSKLVWDAQRFRVLAEQERAELGMSPYGFGLMNW